MTVKARTTGRNPENSCDSASKRQPSESDSYYRYCWLRLNHAATAAQIAVYIQGLNDGGEVKYIAGL